MVIGLLLSFGGAFLLLLTDQWAVMFTGWALLLIAIGIAPPDGERSLGGHSPNTRK